jgi:hypothetical protein
VVVKNFYIYSALASLRESLKAIEKLRLFSDAQGELVDGPLIGKFVAVKKRKREVYAKVL